MATDSSREKAKQAAKERARERIRAKQSEGEAAQTEAARVSQTDVPRQDLTANEAALAASQLADSDRLAAVGDQVEEPKLDGSGGDDGVDNDASLRAGVELGARSTDHSPEADAALDAFNAVMDGTAGTTDAQQRMADTIAGSGGTGTDGPRVDYDGTGTGPPSQADIGDFEDIVKIAGGMAAVGSAIAAGATAVTGSALAAPLLGGAAIGEGIEGHTGIGERVMEAMVDLGEWENEDLQTATREADMAEAAAKRKRAAAAKQTAADAENETIVIDLEFDATTGEVTETAAGTEAEQPDPTGDNATLEEKMAAAERLKRDFGIDPNTGGAVGADTGGDGRTDPVDSDTPADTGGEAVDKDERLRGGDDTLAPGGKYGEVDTDSLDVVTSQGDLIDYGDEVLASTPTEMPDLLNEDITADHTGSGPVVELDMPGQTDESFNTVAVHELENDLGSRVDVNDDSTTKFGDDFDFDPESAVDELFDFDR